MKFPTVVGSTGLDKSQAMEANTQTGTAMLDGCMGATPAKRSLMLSRLIGQAFETLPPPQREAMLSHLLKPLGMLSLATIGSGVFLKNRCQGLGSNAVQEAGDWQDICVSDVVALVDRVQQVSVEVVDAIAQMIEASPYLANSPVIAMLEKIPLRRMHSRHVDDAFL